MAKPTQDDINAAISAHVSAVGQANASLLEVALRLDAAYPDMTDAEFDELKDEVAPLIAAQRRQGAQAIWA